MIAREKIGDIHANEAMLARASMNERERALADSLIDMIHEADTIADLLLVMAETDSTIAPLLEPLIYSLRSKSAQGVGVHAAVIGDILGTQVH